MKYDVIIGLEIHAELKTKSKMFCACDNNVEGKEANTAVCPICLGHPGTLPRPNKQAIEWTILVGLALDGKINNISKFDRKNYFYPDLPKGYQISQYDLPLVYSGFLPAGGENIMITRVHLEEDTGKLTHTDDGATLIDFNRAGTPLIEMVTEPVIKNSAQAKKFCQEYQKILRYLGVSGADMEKGEMRCEANISLQTPGSWIYENGKIEALDGAHLNSKVEVKNINSFRSLEKAIEYEIKRQAEVLDKGEEIAQETRGWNDNKNITVSQRRKESLGDYRYFPEPDIPPLNLSPEFIDNIRKQLIELPNKKQERFISEYGLKAESAELIVSDKDTADWFEKSVSELQSWMIAKGNKNWEEKKTELSQNLGNWLVGEFSKLLNAEHKNINESPITPENFAELIALIASGQINSSAGQNILGYMFEHGGNPTKLMDELNLRQVDNTDILEKLAQEAINSNPEPVQKYRQGQAGPLQFLVGQIMAKSKGQANPQIAREILEKLLK